jgi:hypothetical protein
LIPQDVVIILIFGARQASTYSLITMQLLITMQPLMNMEFDTKVALIVLEDLAVWQKLNVTAFLSTGIAGATPEAMGEPYADAIMVYQAEKSGLIKAFRQSIERELTRAVYVRAMFETGHDQANREAFLKESADEPDLVGIAIRGPRKSVDKAIKGLRLHP